jgi:hypothetical protein
MLANFAPSLAMSKPEKAGWLQSLEVIAIFSGDL